MLCLSVPGSTPPFDASELTPEQQLLANQAKQYRMDIQPGDSDVRCLVVVVPLNTIGTGQYVPIIEVSAFQR